MESVNTTVSEALRPAAVEDYTKRVRAEYETKLKSLVDIPSISFDPACKQDVLRAAEKACALLKESGASAEVIQTKGYPVVIGSFFRDAKYPTVSVYNHIDVQPADASEWRSAPFVMTVEGDKYNGRGTTDDKGPAIAVLYAAKYAYENKFPINIKFIWELEEEHGSPSFLGFLEANKGKLTTDSVVVSDTIWIAKDRPAIAYGLRGLQCACVKLKTGAKDVHSGLVGGLARNPIGELSQLLAECYDAKTGTVRIPGFYEDVRRPSQEELESFVKSGFSLDAFKQAHELLSLRTDDVREAAERIWARPTFEIHGITGGYGGAGVKTIVPHQAEAKVSMRLVPDQDPDKVFALFAAFVKERCPEATISREGSLRPYVGEFSGPYNKAAEEAVKAAFGVPAAFIREGGSIGAVVSMNDVLHVPIVFLGLSLPEHGYHAINENFDWQQASGGMRLFINYFDLISRIKKS
jgi:acetylornithine deacetylase/succinyl-diaminopimelate desuccinylase-like protein